MKESFKIVPAFLVEIPEKRWSLRPGGWFQEVPVYSGLAVNTSFLS